MEMMRQKIGSMMGRIKRELRVDKVKIEFFDDEGRLCIQFLVQRFGGQQYYSGHVLDRHSSLDGFIIDRAVESLRTTMIANGEKMEDVRP